MEHNEIMDQLRAKLVKNIDGFNKRWRAQSPTVVISVARKICATQDAYIELCRGNYSDEALEYLLRFENPLEVVRDEWIKEQYLPNIRKEMGQALQSVMDKQDAEQSYKLDENYKPPEMEQMILLGG